MEEGPQPGHVLQFGEFEADLEAGQLRKNGVRVRLPRQPFQVLVCLLERSGRVVTREALIAELWPHGTVVEYEHSLGTAINKIRQALGDSADNPRFVETLPRRGYRFLVPVEPTGRPPEERPPPVAARAPQPGVTISHYKITEKLGEGGMGVVYKAEDTKLERPVALKFLAPHAIEDPEHEARFVREAKAAARLDHPNICHVYEIDEADGQTFLAMAFLEGRTVKDRIAERPLKLEEALDIAVQTAQGLQAAHEKGIVHRDIKGANLMVTPQGQVKIMDFGLAQLAEGSKLTKTATILGTPAYMSPEQAQRQPTDPRTDVWSLGVVLYEMVTGRLPFEGERDQAVLYAISNEEPQPLTALRTGVPVELDRIVGKALAKDRGDRYQHVDEMLVDLRMALRGSGSARHADASSVSPIRPHGLARQIAVVPILAAAVGLTWWLTRSDNPPPSTQPPVLTRLTSDSGLTYYPALSPDGTLLAYASDRADEEDLDIWVQQVGGGQPIRLTEHEADDLTPVFSPDGRHIIFQSSRDGGGVYIVPSLGGNERLVAARGFNPRFSPDGKWISYITIPGGTFTTFRLLRVSVDGGPPTGIETGSLGFRQHVWSPDGKFILVLGWPGRAADWWLVPVEGGTTVKTDALTIFRRHGLDFRLLTTHSPMVWSAERNDVLFSASLGDSVNVWRTTLSTSTGQVAGPPQRVTSGAGVEVQPSTAANGRVAFANLARNIDLWALPIDPNEGTVVGEMRRLTRDAAPDVAPSLSTDGKILLFRSKRGGKWDLWGKDLTTGEEAPVTSSAMDERRGVITGDGSQVVYKVDRTIYVIDADGGLPRKLCDDCGRGSIWSRSWDGTKVLYWNGPPPRIVSLDLRSGQSTDVLRHPEYELGTAHYSPDGQSISFYVPRTGIFVAPLRDGIALGEQHWIAVTDGSANDLRPFWSPDGELLYFTSNRDGFVCIWAQRLSPRTKEPQGQPFTVHHFHSARHSPALGGSTTWGMPLAQDKLVVPLGQTTGNIWMAEPVATP